MTIEQGFGGGDIEIGAVEIKNGTTDQRAVVNANGGLLVAVDQTTPGTTNGVQVNAALPAGTNSIGNVFLATTAAAIGPSAFRSLTVNSTAQAIKASAGNLYGWNIVNLHSATIYVKFYNIVAASVNPASDAPVLTLPVPANGGVLQEPNCIQTVHSTAISVRAVTDSGDTGTTAPGTLPIIEIRYV